MLLILRMGEARAVRKTREMARVADAGWHMFAHARTRRVVLRLGCVMLVDW